MEKEFIDWKETENLIKELGKKIKESGFIPTIIAPVPRGRLVCSFYTCSNF